MAESRIKEYLVLQCREIHNVSSIGRSHNHYYHIWRLLDFRFPSPNLIHDMLFPAGISKFFFFDLLVSSLRYPFFSKCSMKESDTASLFTSLSSPNIQHRTVYIHHYHVIPLILLLRLRGRLVPL